MMGDSDEIREVLGTFGNDAAVGGERPTDILVKPSLVTMLLDQAELLDATRGSTIEYDIRTGFPTRRAVIDWYQRAVVRSMGHIADEWEPSDCLTDRTLLASLVRSDGHVVAETGSMDPVTAVEYRRVVESTIVQPAFDLAYSTMKNAATEYVKAENDQVGSQEGGFIERDFDPSRQSNVAMRPGFTVLDDRQSRALDRLWGGFDSVSDLSDWLHSMSAPANGAVPDGFESSVTSDRIAVGYLVGEDDDHERSKKYREMFAVEVVLPMFVEGVKSAEASELARSESDGPMTMRQESSV